MGAGADVSQNTMFLRQCVRMGVRQKAVQKNYCTIFFIRDDFYRTLCCKSVEITNFVKILRILSRPAPRFCGKSQIFHF
jgi:hypothetical protein